MRCSFMFEIVNIKNMIIIDVSIYVKNKVILRNFKIYRYDNLVINDSYVEKFQGIFFNIDI